MSTRTYSAMFDVIRDGKSVVGIGQTGNSVSELLQNILDYTKHYTNAEYINDGRGDVSFTLWNNSVVSFCNTCSGRGEILKKGNTLAFKTCPTCKGKNSETAL